MTSGKKLARKRGGPKPQPQQRGGSALKKKESAAGANGCKPLVDGDRGGAGDESDPSRNNHLV